MFGQTVQTQIRRLLEEESDQGIHCLLFHLQTMGKGLSMDFKAFTVKLVGFRKFRTNSLCK